HVLELDGNGSYVQLPDNIFHDFTEGTVEAWVNWKQLGGQRWFGFGEPYDDMGSGDEYFFISPKGNDAYRIMMSGLLAPNVWYQIAGVTGPRGMRVFVNGMLIGTNASSASFNAIAGTRNLIGARNSGTALGHLVSMEGQVGEFRVWKVPR